MQTPDQNIITDENIVIAAEFPSWAIPKWKYAIADIISWGVIISAYFYGATAIVILGIIAEACYIYVRAVTPAIRREVKRRSEAIRTRQSQELN